MSNALYLVAIDGSEWGDRAVDMAVNLAEQTQAKLKIITVVDWSYLQQPMIMEGVSLPILDKEIEENNITARILTPIVVKYKSKDLEIDTELIWGNPCDEINQQVQDLNATMLFVGRHGSSRVVDILLGGVANKLAHMVNIPLVLVP